MQFNNLRPWPQTQRNKAASRIPVLPGKSKFVESRVNLGMITMLDPADIEPGALQLAQNARCRFDRTQRRPGTTLMTPTKPNSNPVIGLFFFKKSDGNTYYFRFTRNSVHSRTATWDAYSAGVGGSLLGSDTDYIQAAVVLDRFVFSNNGVDVLQELDTTTAKYQALGNAPEYKYVTGFFNRVIGANLVGSVPNAAQIGWSGENDPDEWDPLVDETAGSTPLVESPGDLGDDISGVFGFTNVLAILREQSIWLATKQPIPTFPFNPYAAFPGVGCNAPYSAKITANGLTWADRRSATIWHYTPGQAPEPIGRPVEKTLMDAIDDEELVFASYDPIQNEYTVCIPQATGNVVVAWTYNFRTQAWTKDLYEGISIISDADLGTGVLPIDALPGTIESLTGDINSLGPAEDVIPSRAFGRSDGEIILQDDDATTDPSFSSSTGTYDTVLLSKAFTLPTDDIYIAEIRIELIPIAGGTLTLEYSKDGGVTIATPSKSKLFTGDKIGKSQLFRWTKQIKTRRFAWRLSASSGQFEIIGYEVHVYKSGESTK